MIFKPSKNLTLVVYEDQKSPKCFEINKNHLKFFFVLIPLMLLFSFVLILGFLTYFKNIVDNIENREPKQVVELKNLQITLNQQISELEKENNSLIDKIKNGQVTSDSLFPFLKPLAGAQNLVPQKMIEIQNVKFDHQPGKVKVEFNLANKTVNEEKINGHIMVLLQQGNQMYIYPDLKTGKDNFIMNFDQGEKFTFSRFRPVEANFTTLPGKIEDRHIRVLIFSRTGDLLHSEFLQ